MITCSRPGLLVVVDPLDHRVVRQARLTVDFGRQRVLRVEERRVLAVRARRAGHRDENGLEVAVERQRDVGDHLRFDDAAGVGPVGLEHRALARDGDRFLEIADLHLEVHADRGVDVHDHAFAHDLLEAAQLGRRRGTCRPSGSGSV